MKEIKIIRILIGLNLIIFLLPFFNACSNTPLKKENKEILEGIKKSNDLSKEYRDELIQDEKERYIDRKKSNDSYVKNAYELGAMPFQSMEKQMFKEPFFYFTLCYTFQILSVFLMLYFVWKRKLNIIQWMVLINIANLILSLLIPFFDTMLKFMDQIKVGFYIYLLNLIIIYSLILKVKRKTKMNVL